MAGGLLDVVIAPIGELVVAGVERDKRALGLAAIGALVRVAGPIKRAYNWLRRPCRCFVAGTLVLTASGLVAVENIAPGDEVLARDEITGETVYKRVVGLIRTPENHVVSLVVRHADGTEESFEVTPDHPFMTDQGWRETMELQVGAQILTAGESLATVVLITDAGKRATTYNFEVADVNTYFVGTSGLWVHNSCAPKSRGYDRPEIETKSGVAVKQKDATDKWDDFLGPDQTNIDPRDGLQDPDRIWSADGKRSIRFGDHEINSKPNKMHYHQETWHDDRVENVLQRVPQ